MAFTQFNNVQVGQTFVLIKEGEGEKSLLLQLGRDGCARRLRRGQHEPNPADQGIEVSQFALVQVVDLDS